MPKNDRPARLVRIEHLLHQHTAGLTARQIGKLCGVSTRTAYRDIRALDESVGLPLWQDDGRYGIRPGYFLPPVELSLFEATSLFVSSRLAHHHSDERSTDLEGAWSKLAAVLPRPVGRHVQATVAAMAAKPANENFSSAVEILTQAWAEERRVRIEYPFSGTGAVRSRLIEPYFLEPSSIGHSLYVIARDAGLGAMRTFKVERIQGIALTDETFTVPDEFDPASYLGSSWSVSNEESVEVVLSFSPKVARRVSEAVWHRSELTEPQPDGSLIWKSRVAGTLEITPWIRSWGPDVEVIAPEELRRRIAEDSRRQAELY